MDNAGEQTEAQHSDRVIKLASSQGRTTPTMSYIVSEKRVWRELVQAHFTSSQVQFVLNKKPDLKENKNWRRLYLELRKHFGVKQQYSELVMLCKNCR